MLLSVVVVDRNPAASGAPGLVEVGPLAAASGFSLTEKLNLPASLKVTVPSGRQEDVIRQRFADLSNACELWVRDEEADVVRFAGPVLGYQPKLVGSEIAWDVTAAGLLDYLRRWRVEPDGADLTYAGVDQALIAKGLIDYHQALSYGSVGIVTSGVTPTGVLRDRTYAASEAHLIGQRLSELAAVENGFDFRIDPETRAFIVDYPSSGIDRTATVVIDSSSIVDPSAQLSVGPEDLVSEGFAVSTDTGLVGHAFSTDLRQRFGRFSFAAGYSGISDQPTIDDHAVRIQTQRSTVLHNPAAKAFPIGFAWDDFALGDLVEYAFDYGAGLIVEHRRINGRTLSVDDNGAESIEVSFE